MPDGPSVPWLGYLHKANRSFDVVTVKAIDSNIFINAKMPQSKLISVKTCDKFYVAAKLQMPGSMSPAFAYFR